MAAKDPLPTSVPDADAGRAATLAEAVLADAADAAAAPDPAALADALLADLNPEQRAAAAHSDGPLLIVAGAGTGKTATLAHRVAHLIARGIDPGRILLLTFTRSGAPNLYFPSRWAERDRGPHVQRRLNFPCTSCSPSTMCPSSRSP